MQAAGLLPDQREYSFNIEDSQQPALEALLTLLSQTQLDFLVNIHQFHSQPGLSGCRTYSLIVDQVVDKLSDRNSRRQQGTETSISSKELSTLAISCISALSFAQEKVRSTQGLGTSGLAEEVVYWTGRGTVKVDLLEAGLGGAAVPVAQVLYRAVHYRYAESREELEALSPQFSVQICAIWPNLIEDSPNFQEITTHLKPELVPFSVECAHCKLFKPPTIAPICAFHQYCSPECLSAARDSAGLEDSQCPLCSAKVKPRRVVIVKKKEHEAKTEERAAKCMRCFKEFDSNSSDSWRLDRLGSSEYNTVKSYCSEACYNAGNPAFFEESEETHGLSCINCRENVPSQGLILHCGQHGLCSTSCSRAYYRTFNLETHRSYDGAYLCYQCLEVYLAELGSGQDLPEIETLKQKLAYFNESKGTIKGEVHTNCPCCTYIDCGYYLSPGIITLRTYQTFCILCDIPIRISKRIEANYVLNEDSPLLVRCEYRLHGICSRNCLRSKVPNSDFPQAMSCPRCRSSLIPSESLTLALYSNNPTIEAVRRTPSLHSCGDQVPTYVLEGCCHEMCGGSIDANVGEDGLVHCSICGNTATMDEAISAQYQHTVKRLNDG